MYLTGTLFYPLFAVLIFIQICIVLVYFHAFIFYYWYEQKPIYMKLMLINQQELVVLHEVYPTFFKYLYQTWHQNFAFVS